MGTARFPPEKRARLKAAGLWAEFLAIRVARQASDGGSIYKQSGYAWDRVYGRLTEYESEHGVAVLALPEVVLAGEKRAKASGADLEALKSLPDGTDMISATQWVIRHMHFPDLGPSEFPDKLAYSMWRIASRSDSSREVFLNGLGAKLMPTRSQMEHIERQGDDGKASLELIGKVEKARDAALSAGSEGIGRESTVPAEPDPVGVWVEG